MPGASGAGGAGAATADGMPLPYGNGQPNGRPYGRANGNGDPSRDGDGNGNGSNGSNGGRAFDPRVGGLGRRPDVEYVSPLRGGVMPEGGPLERRGAAAATVATLPSIAPAEPLATYQDAPGSPSASDRDVEPALPDEARSRVAAEASAATDPIEAAPAGSVLHVRFAGVPAAQLVSAMEAFRQLARERPGETRVVVHVPAQGGSALPMELRSGIAYDAELLAEVRRRLGDALVQVSVAPPAA